MKRASNRSRAASIPNLSQERLRLAQGNGLVAGSDEVGRGPLAGPVTVGIVIIDANTARQPMGLRDSKLLGCVARESLVPRIKRWAAAWAVGHASAAEIDRLGLMRALRLAGERALESIGMAPDVLLLDGNYDWFTRPEGFHTARLADSLRVEPMIKADLHCASVAAASVLAKVERDHIMNEFAVQYPGYGWHANKGYGTAEHRIALHRLGPCEQHRRSWSLCSDRLATGLATETLAIPTKPSAAHEGPCQDPLTGLSP